MKKVVAVFIILDTFCLTGLAYKFNNILYNLKDNKVLEYEYVDYYGNQGISKHCYEDGKRLICRNGKNGISVTQFKEKRG